MQNNNVYNAMKLLGLNTPVVIDVDMLKMLVVKNGDKAYVVDWGKLLKDYGIEIEK